MADSISKQLWRTLRRQGYELFQSNPQEWRARFLLSSWLSTIMIALVLFTIFYRIFGESHPFTLATLLSFLLFSITLVMFHHQLNQRWLSHFYTLASFLVVFGTAWFAYRLYNKEQLLFLWTCLFWGATLPVQATLGLGRRAGYLYTTLLAVLCSFLALYDFFTLQKLWSDPTQPLKQVTLFLVVVMAVLLVLMGRHFEHTTEEAIQTREAMIDQIRQNEQELIRARDEANRANQAKSQFLANMSHEFRTPLTIILGYTEILVEDLDDLGDPMLLSSALEVDKASRHLLGLLTNLLDFAKMEAGTLQIQRTPLSLADFLRDLLQNITPLLEKNNNTLLVEFAHPLPHHVTDETRLRQILLNLLSNACKFTQGGTVTVRAAIEPRDQEEWLHLQVEDTGIGIAAQHLPQLFQFFHQVHSGDQREYAGAGIGLALSQRLCQMLGGIIAVESVEGDGSVFHVWLPHSSDAASSTHS